MNSVLWEVAYGGIIQGVNSFFNQKSRQDSYG